MSFWLTDAAAHKVQPGRGKKTRKLQVKIESL